MSSPRVTTRLQRVSAAAVGGLVCLVVIMGMFSEPARKRSGLSPSPARQAQTPGCERGYAFTAENVLGLFVIGLVSGTFGGMLGMGGGVLKMSLLLLLFGFHPGISRVAALLSYFVVAVGASYRYLQLNLVMIDVVKVLIPSSVVGIILGAGIGHHLSRDTVAFLLGVFLLFISVVMAGRIVSHYEGVVSSSRGVAHRRNGTVQSPGDGRVLASGGWRIALCGLPGGFLSAMLGISGGVVSNPLQQVLARIPVKNAIANTLLKASVTVPIACLMIMVMGIEAGHFDFWTPVLVALCLIPGSIIGSQLGPALTRRMSSVTVHALFGAVALFMGISLLFLSK